MPQATAEAHPNIALVKYWGKRDGPDNLPATPSLSITLDTLRTRTHVTFDAAARARTVVLNGAEVADAKIEACIDRLVARAGRRLPPVRVDTENNFPTSAGLASSASGVAALVTALDAALGLALSAAERCDETRRASASAARSLYGGFVTLTGGDDPGTWLASPLLPAADWPLQVVIAICAESAKATPSSAGMLHSRTSPFYSRWLAQAPDDFEMARSAVAKRDFTALANVAEANCLAMHAVMTTARPGLVYWNGATVECLHAIRTLRAAGSAVFFTIDAGPQVKAVCEAGAVAAVRAALQSISGVQRVVTAGLGGPARVMTPQAT
jgi:diphosphomevalonate decarboxylase